MGSPNKYTVIERRQGTKVRYSVHNESEKKGNQFQAQFKRKADAYNFIDLVLGDEHNEMRQRAEKAESLALAMASRFEPEDYAALPEEHRLHIVELLNKKYG